MGSMRRRVGSVTVVALVLVGLVFPVSAEADNRLGSNGHWNRQTHNVAHMKLIDRTGHYWPVFAAHLDWDLADNLDVDYDHVGNGWTCDHHCVEVMAVSPANDPYNELYGQCTGDRTVYGYAYFTNGNHVTAANHFYSQRPEIRFNTNCNHRSDRFRRALACQEIGHVLGLDHAGTTSSCMYVDSQYADATPRDHDINDMLDGRIYDHGS